MQKGNVVQNKQSHAELAGGATRTSESSTLAVVVNDNNMRGRSRNKFGMTIDNNVVSGFTLIELLVVVLIIGILAAVALPQYNKAVLKARFASLKPITRHIAEAQKVYFLENEQYATNLEDLNVDLTGFTHYEEYSVGGRANNFSNVWVASNGNFFILENKDAFHGVTGYVSSKEPFGYRIVLDGKLSNIALTGTYCVEYTTHFGKNCHLIANTSKNNFFLENWHGRWFKLNE